MGRKRGEVKPIKKTLARLHVKEEKKPTRAHRNTLENLRHAQGQDTGSLGPLPQGKENPCLTTGDSEYILKMGREFSLPSAGNGKRIGGGGGVRTLGRPPRD